MRNRKALLISAVTTAAFVLAVSECRADGQGVLLQAIGDQLVLGFDDDTPGGQSIGARVFSELLPSTGLSQDPSFLSLSAPPAGVEALPAGVDVYWDFLPMTIDGVTSNLFHWDGQGSIGFSPAQAETLTLYDPNFNGATVDGVAAAVPGERVGTTTSSALSLHAHRWWELAAEGSSPTAGIYAAALRLRVDGFAPTEPFVVALSTFGTPPSVLNDEAMPWFENNLNDLFLAADYNFDGMINNEDYAVWASQFGGGTPQPVDIGEADGNRDRLISAADYALWRDAATSATAVALSISVVPEPTGFGGLLSALCTIAAYRPQHRGQRAAVPCSDCRDRKTLFITYYTSKPPHSSQLLPVNKTCL